MHNDTCYKIEGDEFAHGGFVCNEGKWSTDKCKGYYCDIGYYYDQFENNVKKNAHIMKIGNILLFLRKI